MIEESENFSMRWTDRLVGIFGTGRNGSTLLMRLLDGSAGLWVYPLEMNIFSAFAPRSWQGRVKSLAKQALLRLPAVGESIGREAYFRSFMRWATWQLDDLARDFVVKLADPIQTQCNPIEEMRERLIGSLSDDLAVFLDTVRLAYDRRALAEPPLLAFKSIEVRDLQRYRQLFPKMKFLHIVRHPHTNYGSLKRTDLVLKRKPFWFQGGDILRMQLEDRWIPHVQFVLDAQKAEPFQHHLVRYEDLCANPTEIVRGICRWLGVPSPADPTLQTVLGGRQMKELPINSSKEGVKTPERVVANMAEMFGYDDVLTDRERGLILLRTFELGCRLGYFAPEEQANLPNKFELFRQWMVPDQWEYMNARPKLRLVRALVERRLYLCKKLLLSSS